jgi:hypothetical protein
VRPLDTVGEREHALVPPQAPKWSRRKGACEGLCGLAGGSPDCEVGKALFVTWSSLLDSQLLPIMVDIGVFNMEAPPNTLILWLKKSVLPYPAIGDRELSESVPTFPLESRDASVERVLSW